MKYSDRHLAGLSARPPGPRRTHRRGLSRLRDQPQLRLRLRANKLPSPNHCGESRDFLLVFKNLSRSLADTEKKQQKRKQQRKEAFAHHPARDTLKKKERKQTTQGRDGRTARRHHTEFQLCILFCAHIEEEGTESTRATTLLAWLGRVSARLRSTGLQFEPRWACCRPRWLARAAGLAQPRWRLWRGWGGCWA